jgi:hypothetical protein
MRGSKSRIWLFPLTAAVLVAAIVTVAVRRAVPPEPLAIQVQKEVAEIRGLEFRRPVEVRQLSASEARAFVLRELAKSPTIDDYWAVMRMVGVYRGPDLAPPEEVLGDLANLAAGAYESGTDIVFQFEELDEAQQRLLFAHELYHALQDQHFNLQKYLLDPARRRGANNDQVMALQAAVEGEASYIDSIYRGRIARDPRPVREQMAEIVSSQSGWTADRWDDALRNRALPEEIRSRLLRAIETRKRLPAFMFDAFVASYLDGMAFIHALHEKGWPEIEKLYRDFPPQSTEQILHPEKWTSRESPVSIDWPAFDTDPLFADWQLLDENVLGERLWRVVFTEHGLARVASRAAAGWGGDRYAVFRSRHGRGYLMLAFTVWDTHEDALEFEAAYQQILDTKANGSQVIVSRQGPKVLVVDCPVGLPAGAFMEFNRRGGTSGG